MEFRDDRQFAVFVRQLGGTLWLVGGAVRDELMGDTPHDKDFMVTGVDVSDMPFDKVAGHHFPVFLVKVAGKSCEVAMARKEKKAGIGHKGFQFFTDVSVTVQDDLARRDITINAMAKNVLTGIVVDPFDGKSDLQCGVLRHTTEAFTEDPLRVFRVARFAARFNFDVAVNTLALMQKSGSELHTLPAERVWKELEKTLDTQHPSRFFEVLKSVGVLDVFFQEVAALDVTENQNRTVFNYTMHVMDAGSSKIHRFGLLVHGFSKGRFEKELNPIQHGYGKAGEDSIVSFCNRIRAPKSFQNFGVLCAREHREMEKAHEMSPERFVQWTLGLNKYFNDVLQVSFLISGYRHGENLAEQKQHFQFINEQAKKVFAVERQVTGKMLIKEGQRPDKDFGEILFQRRVELFKTL